MIHGDALTLSKLEAWIADDPGRVMVVKRRQLYVAVYLYGREAERIGTGKTFIEALSDALKKTEV